MLSISSKCEYNYGAMGRVGYLYESIKDQIRWHKLSVKKYVNLISSIGQIMALSEDDYKKEKAKIKKMRNSEMVDALKTMFGDSK